MKQLESPPSGEELKEIRLAYQLTKKEMGEVLHVSPDTVKSYANFAYSAQPED